MDREGTIARFVVCSLIVSAVFGSLAVGNASAATQVVVQEDFESAWPVWDIGDDDATSGFDYWGSTTYRSHQGTHSAWCAQYGTNSGNGQPNSGLHYYDVDMLAFMDIPLSAVSGYDSLTLSFYYWAITGSWSWGDNLEVWSYSGVWSQLWTQEDYDMNSNGWQLVSVSVPTSTIYIEFYFVSDSTVGLGPYEGAYVDDIVVTATDSVAPSSSVSSLSAYQASSSFAVAYTATDAGSGIDFVELYYRLGSSGLFSKYTTSGNPTGHWTSSPIAFDTTIADGDGTYQLYTQATDVFGNPEPAPGASDASTVVDTVAPSTIRSFTGTSGSSGWYLSSITVTLVSSDTTSGVGSTSYRIDAGTWQDYTTSFVYSAEGNHTLEFFSTDRAGNSETPWTEYLKIDTVDPVTEISLDGATGSGDWYVCELVSVSLSATDSSSDVASIVYRIGQGDWHTYTEGFQIGGEGTTTIEFYSEDSAGNTGTQQASSFKIDSTAPSLTIDQLNGTSFKSGTLTISWKCSDTVSGLSKVEYSLDNAAYESCSGGSLELTDASDGPHTVTLKATDNAGNVVERTLSFGVNTNLFSTSGPMGPWLDIGLILIVLGVALTLVLVMKRRKGKTSTKGEEVKPT